MKFDNRHRKSEPKGPQAGSNVIPIAWLTKNSLFRKPQALLILGVTIFLSKDD
jgi:hypothetical protein